MKILQDIMSFLAILIGFLAVGFFISKGHVFALSANSDNSAQLQSSDQPAEIHDVEGLRASFVEGTQDPATKIIQFDLILHSTINSDRVEVDWSLSSSVATFVDSNKKTVFLTIQSGKDYDIPIQLQIVGTGATELLGTATAYQANTTYLVTIRKDFASDQNAQVLPITQAYNTAQTLNTIKDIATFVIGLIVLIILGYISIKLFVKWLNKDEAV